MSWAGMPWCKLAMVLIDKIVTKVERITLSWQFCWCPFWDGENVTLSKVVGELQLGDQKVRN